MDARFAIDAEMRLWPCRQKRDWACQGKICCGWAIGARIRGKGKGRARRAWAMRSCSVIWSWAGRWKKQLDLRDSEGEIVSQNRRVHTAGAVPLERIREDAERRQLVERHRNRRHVAARVRCRERLMLCRTVHTSRPSTSRTVPPIHLSTSCMNHELPSKPTNHPFRHAHRAEAIQFRVQGQLLQQRNGGQMARGMPSH